MARPWRFRPARFAALAWVATVGAGCQGGYPLAATRCDEWCDQIRRVQCGDYNPASCVAGCESAGVGRAECADFVAQALSCLRNESDTQLACDNWVFDGNEPCLAEQQAALGCGAASGRPAAE